MSIMDFLFEGSPPPSVTTYGSSTQSMPQWFSDYSQGLINRANSVASEPYQAYQGPRVAGFNNDQNNVFDVVRNNIGNWKDEVDTADSQGQGALSQSMPYFQMAGQATPDAISRYMSPYTDAVINKGTLAANRNYTENIAPSISDRFIRGGQSGSLSHMRETDRAARDLTEGLQTNAMAQLDQGYKDAGSQFATDASRFGALGASIGSLGLDASRNTAALAQQRQQQSGMDAGALTAIGDTQQQQTQRNLDTAYGDFQQQRDYPKSQVDWMSSILHGLPSQGGTTTTTGTGPANVYQPSPLSQFLSLYGAYKDFTGEKDKKAHGGLMHPLAYATGGRVDHPGPTQQLGRFGHYAPGIKHARETRDRAVHKVFPHARGGLAYAGV